MEVFSIGSFKLFVSLLLATRKLFASENSLDRVAALTELAENQSKLRAVLRAAGMDPLVKELSKVARDADVAFAHNKNSELEDARAIFWQVVPVVICKDRILVGEQLKWKPAANAMVSAAKEANRYFERTPMAEVYFSAIIRPVLKKMLNNTAFVKDLTPELWRAALEQNGLLIERTGQIKQDTSTIINEVAVVRRYVEEFGAQRFTQEQLIALMRVISRNVSTPEQAWNELEALVERVAASQTLVGTGNGEDGLRLLLQRAADLRREGRPEYAATLLDQELADSQAKMMVEQERYNRLLLGAIDSYLDSFDAEGAASKIVQMLRSQSSDRAFFETLHLEVVNWYERGLAASSVLYLEVAYSLAQSELEIASTASDRAMSLNDKGTAIWAVGSRNNSESDLISAVSYLMEAASIRQELGENTYWAQTQSNLSAALASLGAATKDTKTLEAAVAASKLALEVFCVDDHRLPRARTQNNLGNAWRLLGQIRQSENAYDSAVHAYSIAATLFIKDVESEDWAKAKIHVGSAMTDLGVARRSESSLKEAIEHIRSAVEELDRAKLRHTWSWAQENLGNAHFYMGSFLVRTDRHDSGADEFEASVGAYTSALSSIRKVAVPDDWMRTSLSLGKVHMELSQLRNREQNLERSLELFRDVKNDLATENDKRSRAEALINIANANLLKFRDSDPKPADLSAELERSVREAVQYCENESMHEGLAKAKMIESAFNDLKR